MASGLMHPRLPVQMFACPPISCTLGLCRCPPAGPCCWRADRASSRACSSMLAALQPSTACCAPGVPHWCVGQRPAVKGFSDSCTKPGCTAPPCISLRQGSRGPPPDSAHGHAAWHPAPPEAASPQLLPGLCQHILGSLVPPPGRILGLAGLQGSFPRPRAQAPHPLMASLLQGCTFQWCLQDPMPKGVWFNTRADTQAEPKGQNSK